MDRRVRTRAAAPSALADELAGVIVPSRRNAGFSGGILSGETFIGFSSSATSSSPPLAGNATGTISALKRPSIAAAGAGQRLDGEGVLVGARELIALGRRLAEIAHAAARLVGVLEAVEQHVIEDAVVAGPVAAARLGQQVGALDINSMPPATTMSASPRR